MTLAYFNIKPVQEPYTELVMQKNNSFFSDRVFFCEKKSVFFNFFIFYFLKYGLNINTQVETTLLWDLFSIYDTVSNYFISLLLIWARKLGIVEQTKLNMHTTHASTQCSVRQQSVHTKWVWLYKFAEYKNTLEKYSNTTITSVTIYLCYSWLVISFKWVFKKKNTFWVFFGGQVFFAKKKCFFFRKKNTSDKCFFFRIASLHGITPLFILCSFP